jgi:dihydrofolate reductase
VSDGIESAVKQAKAAAGGKSVGVHGADTIQQLLNAGSTSRRFFLAPEFDSLTASPAHQPSLATRL